MNQRSVYCGVLNNVNFGHSNNGGCTPLHTQVLPRGAVATDSQQCSQIGVDALQKGGNAIDAAIASMLCMCVVNPHITSVGGYDQTSIMFTKQNGYSII